MRSVVAISFLFLFLFSAVGALAQPHLPYTPSTGMETTAGADFTHGVTAEYFTTTWCGYCPAADEQLNDIYYNDGYGRNFFLVALITDVNDKAEDRMGDYPDVTGYPTVVFDGGESKVSGQQSDKSSYVEAIEDSGGREDTDISAMIAMEWLGGYNISVSMRVIWNEDGTMLNPTFNGYIRAFIVEPFSRYLNDDGKHYGFGFLDYAFDEPIELDPHSESVLTTTWSGTDFADKNGDDFSDIDYNNLMIIATVFNDESSDTDNYALQVAGAIPPILEVDPLSKDVSGVVEVTGTARGNRSELAELEYRIDDNEWESVSTQEDFRFDWDSSALETGAYNFQVRATDSDGTSNTRFFDVNVTGDVTPPKIEWLAPNAGKTQSGTVTISVDVTDEHDLEAVELKIDDRTYKAMDHDSGDSYTYDWDTTTVTDDIHTVTVRAEDGLGNEQTLETELETNNEGGPTKPAIDLLSPTTDDEPLRDIVQVRVRATDPGATVESVEYTYQGTEEYYELAYDDEDHWDVNWNTVKADSGDDIALRIRATNDNGHSTTENYAFTIDNEPPRLTVTAPTMETNQAWATIPFTIEAIDEQGPVTPQYRVDQGSWTDLSFTGSYTHTFDWDTTTVDDGYHELQFQVTDGADHTQQWSETYEVVNGELVQFLTDLEPPAADENAELTITVVQAVTGVDLVITAPIRKTIAAIADNTPGRYIATFPTFEEHEGEKVAYHLLLKTDRGNVETESRTFMVQPASTQPGASNSSDDDDNTIIYVAVAAAIIVVLGGVGFFLNNREEEAADEWGMTTPPPMTPVTPVSQPMLAQPPVGPAIPTPPTPVACPGSSVHNAWIADRSFPNMRQFKVYLYTTTIFPGHALPRSPWNCPDNSLLPIGPGPTG